VSTPAREAELFEAPERTAGERYELPEPSLHLVWGRVVEVAFGRNLALDAEVIALHGTIAAYASDAEPEPRLPFWELLFKNITIRLVGSDDLPEDAERRAVEDIAACLEAGALHPRIALRLPLEGIAEAHEAVEGGRSGGRIILDIA
jgi:NADPH2:quinone reductase